MLKETQLREERGAAMIVAVVVSMVIMVFSLILLLSAYSLYNSTLGGTAQLQCRELAASISKEVGQELTGQTKEAKTPLYTYLRAMLWQEEAWPAYDPDDAELDAVSKYFALEIPEQYEELADQVLMTLYWTVEKQEAEEPSAVVHIRIKASKNEEAYVMERAYKLEITRSGTEEITEETAYGTEIDQNEQWVFVEQSGV